MSEFETGLDLSDVTPQRVIRLLTDSDWVQTGGRSGLYARFAARQAENDQLGHSVVIPLNPEAPDYQTVLVEAIDALKAIRTDDDGTDVVNRILTTPTDEFSFAKETAAPRGWIRWDDGMSLLESARAFLASGAKSAREPAKYFGNRYGQFAKRFLGEVMMGQTAVGSYVVRAYVPTSTVVPIHGGVPVEEAALFPGTDSVVGRDVSQTLLSTLEAATDALDYFRATESFAAFTEGDYPISYEAVRALQAIASNADESAVRVAWEPDTPETPAQTWAFEFSPDAAPVLAQAAVRLMRPEPHPETPAEGTVHLLTRAEESGPGVIGITTLTGHPANKVRVQLQGNDYHRAVLAHDEGQIVHVVGNLEKEGNLSWLYDARITSISAPVDPATRPVARREDRGLFELPGPDDG